MKNKYVIVGAMLGISLLAVSCKTAPRSGETTALYGQQEQKVNAAQDFRYAGENGKNALDLLKGKYTVETQSFSGGEFVSSINGIKPDANHFWAFYINGQSSNVGAGSYVTNDGDVIDWKLEAIDSNKQ